MNYIDIKKERLRQDIKFYRYFMKYNIIGIIVFSLSIVGISWLIYLNMASTLLHVLLGTQSACIIFIFGYYQQTKIDYKNALEHLSLIEGNGNIETSKIYELQSKINELEGVIYAERSKYQSLRATNSSPSSVD